MTSLIQITTLAGLGFLVSCASKPAPPSEAEVLSQLDPLKWQVEREIPMESTANVANAAEIKAYPVGRYVDAANPGIMHERHTIYRREQDESWRRDTNRGHGILLGPTVGLDNPIARKNPSSQELASELTRQKLVTKRLLSLESQAGAGDARAQKLLGEAKLIAANQTEILRRLEQYDADRRAEQLKVKLVPSASQSGNPIDLPIPERLDPIPPKAP
jgi:hypothetical protein